jgi:hypothetical protein
MPCTITDESTIPMLGNHSLEDYNGLDIEEHSTDVNKGSEAKLYHNRQDSYTSWWSSETITPSRKSRPSMNLLMWLRWAVLVGLQSIIIFLLCQRPSTEGEMDATLKGKVVETGDDINELYKTCELIPSARKEVYSHKARNVIDTV